jgi:hypothetical protein
MLLLILLLDGGIVEIFHSLHPFFFNFRKEEQTWNSYVNE